MFQAGMTTDLHEFSFSLSLYHTTVSMHCHSYCDYLPDWLTCPAPAIDWSVIVTIIATIETVIGPHVCQLQVFNWEGVTFLCEDDCIMERISTIIWIDRIGRCVDCIDWWHRHSIGTVPGMFGMLLTEHPPTHSFFSRCHLLRCVALPSVPSYLPAYLPAYNIVLWTYWIGRKSMYNWF